MNKPLVSIILPTYNSEEKIKTTLYSIKSQTYPFIETIIVDSYSTDRTLELIDNSLLKIKIVKMKAKGIYPAINKGIENSSGELIFHLNSDDFISFNAIEHLVVNLNKLKLNVIWLPIYSEAGLSKEITLNKLWFGVDRAFFGHSASFMAKKSVFKQYGLYNTIKSDIEADLEYFYKLYTNKEKLIAAPYKQNSYGVFTSGGASCNLKYRDKIIYQIKYRHNNSHRDISDFIFCYLIGPLRLIWGFSKNLFHNL